MSGEDKKLSPSGNEEDTPRNTIRVIKSNDSDDTVVEVKVAGESEAKVTVFGGESPKNEKVETVTDDKKKEPETKQDESKDTKKEEKDEQEPEPFKPLSAEEIDTIVKKYSHMNAKDLKKYLDFFWSIDMNRYGAFNIQQFAFHLKQRGVYLADRRIAEIFTDIDHNNDMLISLDEYLTEMSKNKRRPRTEEEMKELFEFYDRNGDGYVCRKDIREAMAAHNLHILEPCIGEFLDSDRTGRREKLNLQDFTRAVKRLKL
ncbi:hypothetical protein ACF0H5_018399 [Mactra antiquata]